MVNPGTAHICGHDDARSSRPPDKPWATSPRYCAVPRKATGKSSKLLRHAAVDRHSKRRLPRPFRGVVLLTPWRTGRRVADDIPVRLEALLSTFVADD
jgi:hypothetical protein